MASFTVQIPVPRFSGVGQSISSFIADLKVFAASQTPKWENEKIVAFLPLCLDGAAKVAFGSLTTEQKASLATIESGLKTFFVPLTPVAQQIKLSQTKFDPSVVSFDLFLVSLCHNVQQAFPDQQSPSKDLLFNYLLQALPARFCHALVSSGISDYDSAVSRVRNLLAAEALPSQTVAAVHPSPASAVPRDHQSQPTTDDVLKQILDRLTRLETEARSRPAAPRRGGRFTGDNRRCYACNATGHLRADCRHRNAVCRNCNRQGHIPAACQSPFQGNETGGTPPARRQ